MIPKRYVTEWSESVRWKTPDQVEQDLVISRALVEMYNHPYIKDALVFRGGTALNKLFIHPASRYSEDIDFVQKRAEPIGQTLDAIRAVLTPWLGEPKCKITKRGVKLMYRYESVAQSPSKLKVEINTTEHFHVLPLQEQRLFVDSSWYENQAEILTYEIEELMATKLRALYQRRKGRDLFDLWYVVSHDRVDLDQLIDIFEQYCVFNQEKIPGSDFMRNLELKKDHTDFKKDMDLLLSERSAWNFEQAYAFVIDQIIARLP